MARKRIFSARTKHVKVNVTQDDKGTLFAKNSPHARRVLKSILKDLSVAAKDIVSAGKHTRIGTQIPKKKKGTFYKTSGLARSIKPDPIVQHGAYISGSVTANAPYSRYYHNGTKPHIIEARPGGHLYFWGKNLTATRKVRGSNQTRKVSLPDRMIAPQKVMHGGARAHPFLKEAAAVVVAKRGGRI